MARKKITEYKAKELLLPALSLPFTSLYVTDTSSIDEVFKKLDAKDTYVVKVDQGVKGRFKKGLVAVDKKANDIKQVINDLQKKGYSQFIIEPFIQHEAKEEKYLSLSRTRNGIEVFYSDKGGIDIEKNQNAVKKFVFSYSENSSPNIEKEFADIQQIVDISLPTFQDIVTTFEKNYFSFLEINPLVVKDNNLFLLDLAVEVDSTAEFFVNNAWTQEYFTEDTSVPLTKEEKDVEQLASKSQAAFSLKVLNKDGALGMLLSGGGASVTIADEAYNQGKGELLLNYGEYSGNPNQEEVYLYTKDVLSLLLSSQVKKKALIIAGGVANFTSVTQTFKGIIQALQEQQEELQKQNILVFVRRGGPNQDEGLGMMRTFLNKNKLLGYVAGPEMVLTDIVRKAIDYVGH